MRRGINIYPIAGFAFILIWMLMIAIFLTPLFGVDLGTRLWTAYGRKMYFYLFLLALSGLFFGVAIGTYGSFSQRLGRAFRAVAQEPPYSFFGLMLALALFFGAVGASVIYVLCSGL